MVNPSGSTKIVKKRLKKFKRPQSDRILHVPASWRRPKGIDGTYRRRFKGHGYMVSIGFGSNKKTRHMLPNGFFKFSVTSEQDIELLLMHNGKYAAELAHNLSAKTRKAVVARADQMNVCVLNRNSRLSTEESD